MIQDPQKKLDRKRNLIDSSVGHVPLLHKISSKSVHNFWRYFADTHTAHYDYVTVLAEVKIMKQMLHKNSG